MPFTTKWPVTTSSSLEETKHEPNPTQPNPTLKATLKKYWLLVSLVRVFRRLRRLPARAIQATVCLAKEVASDRDQFIARAQASYYGDGLATRHFVGFLHNEKFLKSYNSAFDGIPPSVSNILRNQDISWRAHICTWAATQALKLDGDFVECGVWYGILSKSICEYVDFERLDHRFYLFDSWGNMPGSHQKESYQEDIYKLVQERFTKYQNVSLFRGLVPEVLEAVKIDKIAYLGIDMNGSIAERAALEKLYDKVVSGGIIYFDDYGWNYPELRKTVDEFFEDKPESLLHFPNGNSIVVKL